MPHVCYGLTHASSFERNPHVPQVCDKGQQHLDRNCEETESVSIKNIYEKKAWETAGTSLLRGFVGRSGYMEVDTFIFLVLDLGDVVAITGRISIPILNLIIININWDR